MKRIAILGIGALFLFSCGAQQESSKDNETVVDTVNEVSQEDVLEVEEVESLTDEVVSGKEEMTEEVDRLENEVDSLLNEL